jgi:hypothetical protein
VASEHDKLPELIASIAAPVVEQGKAKLCSRRIGDHFEIEIAPGSSTACRVEIVGAVPTDLSLGVGDPPLTVDLWTPDEASARATLESYLEAIFSGRVSQKVWLRNGEVIKGTTSFRLADNSVVKHHYSHAPYRISRRVQRNFTPY